MTNLNHQNKKHRQCLELVLNVLLESPQVRSILEDREENGVLKDATLSCGHSVEFPGFKPSMSGFVEYDVDKEMDGVVKEYLEAQGETVQNMTFEHKLRFETCSTNKEVLVYIYKKQESRQDEGDFFEPNYTMTIEDWVETYNEQIATCPKMKKEQLIPLLKEKRKSWWREKAKLKARLKNWKSTLMIMIFFPKKKFNRWLMSRGIEWEAFRALVEDEEIKHTYFLKVREKYG